MEGFYKNAAEVQTSRDELLAVCEKLVREFDCIGCIIGGAELLAQAKTALINAAYVQEVK